MPHLTGCRACVLRRPASDHVVVGRATAVHLADPVPECWPQCFSPPVPSCSCCDSWCVGCGCACIIVLNQSAAVWPLTHVYLLRLTLLPHDCIVPALSLFGVIHACFHAHFGVVQFADASLCVCWLSPLSTNSKPGCLCGHCYAPLPTSDKAWPTGRQLN